MRAEAAGISVVNVSSTGSSVSELAVGDILTIELVANNDTHLDIYGMGLIAWGYDVDADGLADDGLRMVSVESVSSIFNSTVLGSGAVVGGIPDVFASHPNAPREQEIPSRNTGLQTYLSLAVSLTPANGDGSLDIGLGGASIADGDIHFRIAFQATSRLDATEITLNFGIGDPTATLGNGPTRGQVVVGDRGIFLPFENDTLRVMILGDPGDGTGTAGGNGGAVGAVPEPGAAILFIAGILTAGLARRR